MAGGLLPVPVPLLPLPLLLLPLLPFLLLLLSGTQSTVGDIKMTSLSVSSGSSLRLPTNCTFDASNHYELHTSHKFVGSYSHDYLMSRLQFSGRLQFDPGSCGFILMNLTEKDSDVYTFVTKYDEKKRIQSQKEDFNITVIGRIAPESPPNNSSHEEGNIFGLAICFLLDPSVAVIIMSIYQLFLWCVSKCTDAFPGARPPCLRYTHSLLTGDTSQNVVSSGFEFGEWVSLGAQVVGTVLLICWKINDHEHSVMWPICSAIGFIIEVVIKGSSYLCALLQRAMRCCPHYLMLFRPFLTSGSIVVVFSVIYRDILMTKKTWYICAAIISLLIRGVLIAFYYRKLKINTNEKKRRGPKLIAVKNQEPPAERPREGETSRVSQFNILGPEDLSG